MSAATIIADAFGEFANLYTVLALPTSSNVSASRLRKAYYKRALLYHPDKLDGSLSKVELEKAKLKFQAVSVAYAILSDPDKRRDYDEFGEIDDNEDDGNTADKSATDSWKEYFRAIFGAVTKEDIDKFTLQYKCSDEEEKDVLKYYTQFKGDLNKMLECVMCSSDFDKKRWVEDYIHPAVQRGDVKDYRNTVETTLHCPSNAAMEEEEHGDGDDDEGYQEEMEEATESDDDSGLETSKKSSSASRPSNKRTISKKGASSKSVVKHKLALKAKAKTKNDSDSLIAAIQGNVKARREQAFHGMISGLEERYGGGDSNKKKRNGKNDDKSMTEEDIPEAEFEKIRAGLDNNTPQQQKSCKGGGKAKGKQKKNK